MGTWLEAAVVTRVSVTLPLVAVPLAGNVLLGEKLQVGEPLAVVGPTERASVTLFVPVPS